MILTETDSTHVGAGQVEVIVGQAIGWFDTFFVRKYVVPEPSHGSWGAEEGAPGYFKITGNALMTAGASNELTITAYDANDNVATGYTGSKSLTFSGPSNAPDGTVPTVEATAIGTATAINFTNGVSDPGTATLIAYRAETIAVDVTDGTINSFADPSYDLDLTVSPGAANNLNFDQQPTDTVAGAIIAPPVTVEVRDQWNNVCITNNTTSVGVAINNNPGGGTLSGTTPQTASSGIATFNDLSIDRNGSGYTLDATSAGLSAATSNPFNITIGTADKITIEDSADGSGEEMHTKVIAVGKSFTAYAISRDTAGNFVTLVKVNWSLFDKSGGVVDSDLVASGDKKSATFTGNAGGTARIRAQHATLGNDTTGTITVTSQQNSLTITAGKGGTTEPAPGNYTYDLGTEVTIRAIPDTGYRFSGWSGDASGLTNPITVIMNSDKSIKPNFIRIIYAPLNFSGEKVLNRSLSQAEYINVLTWETNPNNAELDIVKYRIYEINGESWNLLVELNPNTFEYWHRDVDKDKQYMYALVAVNDEGREGDPAYITVQ